MTTGQDRRVRLAANDSLPAEAKKHERVSMMHLGKKMTTYTLKQRELRRERVSVRGHGWQKMAAYMLKQRVMKGS